MKTFNEIVRTDSDIGHTYESPPVLDVTTAEVRLRLSVSKRFNQSTSIAVCSNHTKLFRLSEAIKLRDYLSQLIEIAQQEKVETLV